MNNSESHKKRRRQLNSKACWDIVGIFVVDYEEIVIRRKDLKRGDSLNPSGSRAGDYINLMRLNT